MDEMESVSCYCSIIIHKAIEKDNSTDVEVTLIALKEKHMSMLSPTVCLLSCCLPPCLSACLSNTKMILDTMKNQRKITTIQAKLP